MPAATAARPYPDIDAARAARANFTDLADFIDAYTVAGSVLLTAQDFHDLGAAYLGRARANNISHAEIFFDPQAHLVRCVCCTACGLHRLQHACISS